MHLMELKEKYNAYINRYKKAERFLETYDPNKYDNKEHFKLMLRFNSIVKVLSNLQDRYKEVTGVEMTDKEKFNGFN
ncbi:MAG: hypothetical protein E7C49_11785 [Clostridium sp.]|nr:hypothetical protein [Clostridium sp.]